MPMNPRDYPPDWQAISLRKREAAGWRCEKCGIDCLRQHEGLDSFFRRTGRTLPPNANPLSLRGKYTLTVHHPNHDKSNPDAELQALCAPCHLSEDRAHHLRKGRENRLRKRGQLTLTEAM